jgi:hypothetical protein
MEVSGALVEPEDRPGGDYGLNVPLAWATGIRVG